MKQDISFRIYAYEWMGMYQFIYEHYSEVGINAHPYHMTLNDYLHRITTPTIEEWVSKCRHVHKKKKLYTFSIPLHAAVILWHELQHGHSIRQNVQDFLAKLDQTLVNAGLQLEVPA
ncbi:hypothetical protein [Telluribacter sp.]|jgi:hypothetical protein|uniref:hypothetical protein n=1 Tax=Telluribacter sp. TaxID=1978767 RepID=UPI002E1525F6|nr:hypothetical protein [Telluribacter sp.]